MKTTSICFEKRFGMIFMYRKTSELHVALVFERIVVHERIDKLAIRLLFAVGGDGPLYGLLPMPLRPKAISDDMRQRAATGNSLFHTSMSGQYPRLHQPHA